MEPFLSPRRLFNAWRLWAWFQVMDDCPVKWPLIRFIREYRRYQ